MALENKLFQPYCPEITEVKVIDDETVLKSTRVVSIAPALGAVVATIGGVFATSGKEEDPAESRV